MDEDADMKRMAFERKTSIADLIRNAVTETFGEDIEDIRDGEEELRRYYADRSTAVSLDFLKARRKARVRG
jgi:hypothetical protein